MAALLAPARELAGTVSDPAQLVAGLVTLHVRRHAEHDQLCRVGDTELRSLSAARRGRVIELRDAYQEIWEEAIARGVHAGQFAVPDVKLAALALLQMCTGVAHWYSASGRLTIGQVSGAFADMAAALLGSPAGAQHAVSRPAGAAAAAGGHG
jgi:hypothetical protein